MPLALVILSARLADLGKNSKATKRGDMHDRVRAFLAAQRLDVDQGPDRLCISVAGHCRFRMATSTRPMNGQRLVAAGGRGWRRFRDFPCLGRRRNSFRARFLPSTSSCANLPGDLARPIHRPQPIYFYLPHLLHRFAPWSILVHRFARPETGRGWQRDSVNAWLRRFAGNILARCSGVSAVCSSCRSFRRNGSIEFSRSSRRSVCCWRRCLLESSRTKSCERVQCAGRRSRFYSPLSFPPVTRPQNRPRLFEHDRGALVRFRSRRPQGSRSARLAI